MVQTDPGSHPKSRGPARRAMRTGPTIDDVAAAAGVSRGTVSRVLNGGHHVSASADAAVRRAIMETGYVANYAARSLVTRRADAVAFVLLEPTELLFEDPNFHVLLRGCTESFAERDIALALMIASNDAQRTRVVRYLRSGHVDGALLVSAHAGDPIISALEESRVPAIACGRPMGRTTRLPYVGADDLAGARRMTEYLVALGRRRIGMISGPLDTPGGLQRLEGFTDVLGRRATRSRIVSAAEYSELAGEAAMKELLSHAPDLDAVFVASDLLAAGALTTLRRQGRSVPDDVAVGGFDDSRIAREARPPLTTMRQPFDRIASELADLFVRAVDNQSISSVVLETELVRRESA